MKTFITISLIICSQILVAEITNESVKESGTVPFKERIGLLSDNYKITSQDDEVLPRIYACRVSSKLRGYENEPNYICGYVQIERLKNKFAPENYITIPDKVVKRLQESYDGNKEEFDRFFEETLSKDDVLRKFTREEIENAIIRNAYYSYNLDPKIFELNWKFSYIHPICKPINPNMTIGSTPSISDEIIKMQKKKKP
ncbi:MAG: hypothetical protein ACSHX4_03885 [Opitutaceae bacterium]